jgi:hypothetical protein
MNALTSFANRSLRTGFHFYPDSLHYRESDLAAWLPELKALGAGWLVLLSSSVRAIPEHFLCRLVEEGIEPIIQFIDIPLYRPSETRLLEPLLQSYARWGCKTVQFFDTPNCKSSWQGGEWSQRDLIERFLDRWLPLANLTIQNGLVPLFPPLEPGGAYWDTAFLLGVLEGLKRRRQTEIIENLILSAYGWSFQRSLNWGTGGPRRWKESRPYSTPQNSQDQRGFRAYEWYQTIAEAVLGHIFPIVILQAGLETKPSQSSPDENFYLRQANDCLNIAHLAANQLTTDALHPATLLEPLPASVIACNYYCLATAPSSPYLPFAWFQAPGVSVPAAQALKTFTAQHTETQAIPIPRVLPQDQRAIRHYLLIPSFEWGVSDFHLEIIRPFIKKYRPTIGFSSIEAATAQRVTVINDAQCFPAEVLSQLHRAGCQVDWIAASGTDIASILSQR